MDYRIIERPSFEMFGIAGEISYEKPFEDVPNFWNKCTAERSLEAINALLGRFPETGLYSALYDYSDNSDEGFKYMICYFLPKGLEVPEKFTKLSLPALTWAVFNMPAGINMQEFRRRIWSEWFPTSEYEQVKAPEFEAFEGAHTQMWVPVRKKQIKE